MKWLFALVLLTAPAFAHSWYGWECCHDQDCKELPAGAVIEGSDGYVLKETGELIPPDKVKQGQDEFYHLCRRVTIICLYTPMRGV